jgi:hypothetical protein
MWWCIPTLPPRIVIGDTGADPEARTAFTGGASPASTMAAARQTERETRRPRMLGPFARATLHRVSHAITQPALRPQGSALLHTRLRTQRCAREFTASTGYELLGRAGWQPQNTACRCIPDAQPHRTAWTNLCTTPQLRPQQAQCFAPMRTQAERQPHDHRPAWP